MRSEQHVSVPRSGQLAVLTGCRARGARFAVAQDARRDDPGLATIRNPGNVGYGEPWPVTSPPAAISAMIPVRR